MYLVKVFNNGLSDDKKKFFFESGLSGGDLKVLPKVSLLKGDEWRGGRVGGGGMGGCISRSYPGTHRTYFFGLSDMPEHVSRPRGQVIKKKSRAISLPLVLPCGIRNVTHVLKAWPSVWFCQG